MRYNDTMVGAATATGRTDNGGSSTGPHINSAASIAAQRTIDDDPQATASALAAKMAWMYDQQRRVAEQHAKHAEEQMKAAAAMQRAAESATLLTEMERDRHEEEIAALKARIIALEGRVARRTTQRDEFKRVLKSRDDYVARLEEEVLRLRPGSNQRSSHYK